MPRKSAGARLYKRTKGEGAGIWIIRDGGRFVSTGTRDRRQAEGALARYIAQRDRPAGPSTPDEMKIARALAIYGQEHVPLVKDQARIGQCFRALVPLLGDLPVSAITGEVCRRYGKMRERAPGTIRKELNVLAAAINHCHAEGYITSAPRVRLPAKPPSRDRWLTRDEVARLIRACRSNPRSRHLARFILVAVHTGTRKDAILRLQYMPNTAGGWVDTKAGKLYRRGEGEAETNKRTPTVPIPRPLLAHLRRWERNGARYVVEVRGQRVGSVKTAWSKALKKSGIDHCTRHDLRHTAVTWAMQRGADMWAASGFFGMSLKVLESTYGHHHPDHLRSAVEAMERKA